MNFTETCFNSSFITREIFFAGQMKYNSCRSKSVKEIV